MKSLFSLLEPEEFVGKLWHDIAGRAPAQKHFPEASVAFEEMRQSLAVLFRGLGGAPGLRLAVAGEMGSAHRPTLRQRIAGAHRLTVARRNGQALYLPPLIDSYPTRAENRALYVWLAAFFAHLPLRPPEPFSVARDVAFLQDVRAATETTLTAAPGLIAVHATLCASILHGRPQRRLPPAEAAVEQAIRALLGRGGEADFASACIRALGESARAYRPFLPAPLWGEARTAADGAAPAIGEVDARSNAASSDERTRKARRSQQEQTERRDYLALNRFEKLLTMAESMNLARPVEDDDEDSARRAAENAGEIVLSPHGRRAATRLKLELDLASAAVAEGAVAEGLRYPEWDWRHRVYRAGYCRVRAAPAPAGDAAWQPTPETQRRIRRVRRQFEALQPRYETIRAQIDGDELDLEALVRARADFSAGGTPSERIYQTTRKQTRDLAVALLVDASLSTEAWVGTQRVIDIAREAALLFCHALDAGGDANAVYSFTSKGRNDVRVDAVKEFSESLSPMVVQRVGALKPGHYTRIGAALRHVAAELASQPARRRLLLVLTDGKPNDCDHYEGRFGVEDARRAIQEARRAGASVFGVTIDARAQAHFPVLFGRGGFAIIADPARLPAMMPLLLRHIMSG